MSAWKLRTHRSTRRRFLGAAGTLGAGLAGAALMGCSDSEEGGDGDAATATSTATTGGTAAPRGEPRGGTYLNHIPGDPPTIDPYKNQSFATKGFAGYVYSRLFKVGTQPGLPSAQAEPVPDLAESAESEDGQHWVVKLRQGVKFHDIAPVSGREVTTEDVLYSWSVITAEDSLAASEVANISQVEATDDYTLNVTLTGPSPTFLEQMADANLFWVMPKEADGGFDAATQPIGSGPWILQEYRTSSEIHFVRNPDWYDPDHPLLDGVRQAIIPEYANSLAQFQAGNLHQLGIPGDDVLNVREQGPDLQWSGELAIGSAIIYFAGPEIAPDAPWRDERFRQAVSMALNRDAILELAYNVQALSDAGIDVFKGWNNVVAAGYGPRFWLDPQSEEAGPSAAYFEHNPEETAALLSAVGVDQPELPLTYASQRYGATFERVAEAIAGMLSEAGFQAQPQPVDYNAIYITQTTQGNLDAAAFGPMTGYPEVGPHLTKLFVRQPYSRGGLGNQEVVDLATAQSTEMDPDRRSEMVKEIQRINAEHMLYVPTSYGAGTSFVAFQRRSAASVRPRATAPALRCCRTCRCPRSRAALREEAGWLCHPASSSSRRTRRDLAGAPTREAAPGRG